MSSILLSGIVIYPVKSLAGIAISSSIVDKTGLQYDRKWMLIDNEGYFLSQRTLPQMALIKTAIQADNLVLSATGQQDLILPLSTTEGRLVDCVIWHDQYQALHYSKLADQWFSDFLQQPCRLVYHPDSAVRTVDQNYAKPNDQTAFSDGFPFLLVSENSLVALNNAMQLEFTMSRFRPNLIVSGCASYEEDTWREITIGTINFRLPKPCSRCSVPTIDPVTAETGKEPLSTLNRTRKSQNKVYFGQNVIHDQCGLLAVNDLVVINKIGLAQPLL